MDDYRNGASSICGFNSAALELNADHKCAICYLEQPVVQPACGHRFCGDCIVRYDLKLASLVTKIHFKVKNSVLFTKFPFHVFFIFFLDFFRFNRLYVRIESRVRFELSSLKAYSSEPSQTFD